MSDKEVLSYLKEDEKAALLKCEYECTLCGHLGVFHDDGDGGFGARCNICTECKDKNQDEVGFSSHSRLRDEKKRAALEEAKRKRDEADRLEREVSKRVDAMRAELKKEVIQSLYRNVPGMRAGFFELRPELTKKPKKARKSK